MAATNKLTIKFKVGRSADGFDAYAKDGNGSILTSGNTMAELKANAVYAYNEHADYHGLKKITEDNIEIEFVLESVFAFYGIINAKALSTKIGMSNTLLSQYVNGIKKPSPKQVAKIAAGLRQVGKELAELQLA
jgi:hypothetical protein